MNDRMSLRSNSPGQTLDIGACLGGSLVGGELIALCGPLGAGKTQIAKGIARGLDIAEGEAVVSPTFVLLRQYTGRLALQHMDIYRLHEYSELEAIGFEELRESSGAVVVVEWADRFPSLLAQCNFVLDLDHLDGNARRISVSVSYPTRYTKLLKSLGEWAGI